MCLYLFVRSSFILSSAASLRTHLSVSTSKAAGRQPSAAAQPASIVSNITQTAAEQLFQMAERPSIIFTANQISTMSSEREGFWQFHLILP